jgi:hypothetical protein
MSKSILRAHFHTCPYCKSMSMLQAHVKYCMFKSMVHFQVRAAWTKKCSIDINMQYRLMGMEYSHGHAACTGPSAQSEHAAWTRICRMDMDMQHIRIWHGLAAWRWTHSMNWDMQHGHGNATWIWPRSMDVDMQHGHGHVAWTGTWTCNMHMFLLHVHVHAACPSTCCVSMYSTCQC